MAMLPAPQANLPATTKAYKNAASQKPTGEAHGKQLAFRGDVNGHKCSTADPVATGLRKPSRLRGLALALMQTEMARDAQHDAIEQRRIRSAPMMKFERLSLRRTVHNDRQRAAKPPGARQAGIRGGRVCAILHHA